MGSSFGSNGEKKSFQKNDSVLQDEIQDILLCTIRKNILTLLQSSKPKHSHLNVLFLVLHYQHQHGQN